uniref:Anthranilate synthase component 2 n=1 Tax=Yamadaella caenomyce TaxID=259029 RepID=A0A1G4NYD2_9FLOR|nr:Anthranilate synthase component II [Yamadaella caenomyce]SCW23703.1 Anthranilate synthase component II [Yamadaella caenomyce]
MILIIDNYDSFTYNLDQAIGDLGFYTKVYRNDSITLEKIKNLSPAAIILSPGPGSPVDSGISLAIIKNLSSFTPILGVCLGHQAIAYSVGGQIVHAQRPIHGKTSWVYHNGKHLFRGLANPMLATRYHSLSIKSIKVSEDLEINAWSEDGTIMGCSYRKYPNVHGIQFHPESLWTKEGKQILYNFLTMYV